MNVQLGLPNVLGSIGGALSGALNLNGTSSAANGTSLKVQGGVLKGLFDGFLDKFKKGLSAGAGVGVSSNLNLGLINPQVKLNLNGEVNDGGFFKLLSGGAKLLGDTVIGKGIEMWNRAKQLAGKGAKSLGYWLNLALKNIWGLISNGAQLKLPDASVGVSLG